MEHSPPYRPAAWMSGVATLDYEPGESTACLLGSGHPMTLRLVADEIVERGRPDGGRRQGSIGD